MFKYLKQKWLSYSYLGVTPEQTISVKKRIILTNQIAIISFVLLLSMSIDDMGDIAYYNIYYFLNLASIFSILTIPYFNKKGGYKFTALLLAILTPIFTLIFSTLWKIGLTKMDISYYFYGRFLLVALLILPLILINYNRRIVLIICVLVNLFCIFIYDDFHNLLGVGVKNMQEITYDEYFSLNYFILYPIILLLLGFYFLTTLNMKYEKKIFVLVEEMTEQNEILEQNQEEIKAQLEEITQQRERLKKALDVIAFKNKNITDSITYASRIQNAILPKQDILSDIFAEYFILYKPRDIVSGDFYFAKKIDDKIYLCAADCTGHGVPGAFMSMLGITLIDEIIGTHNIGGAAEILTELRVQLKKALNQSGIPGEQQDGMDLAFCVIDMHKMELNFAGANNPLFYIFAKNNNLQVYAPNRQPVGIYYKETIFTEHLINISKDDKFYIFSDGYYSQFGGQKNLPLKNKYFKEIICEMAELNLPKQQELLEQKLKNWAGENQQTDDILVIGIKI